MKTAIVTTTIYEPLFLAAYLDNLDAFHHREDTTIYVVTDRKTPASVYAAAHEARRRGFHVLCQELPEQEQFLDRLGLPSDFIPWNTDNRRNIGFLAALEDGCEVLISIDDDNFCLPDLDFVGTHRRALGLDRSTRSADEEVSAIGRGWFNPCAMLRFDSPGAVFPRGFPYKARAAAVPPPVETGPEPRADGPVVAINAGLWLGDPDVDAITRLAMAPRSIGFPGPSVVLDADLWMPIDSQNTAITRAAAAAYYYIRMGEPVRGLVLDRFGDIFSGYFVEKCAKHLGQAVRVGTPVAEHRRSPHDLLQDLFHELAGVALLEDFGPWLREERLEGATYAETYSSLASHVEGAVDRFRGAFWEAGGRQFLRSTAQRMRTWLAALQQVA